MAGIVSAGQITLTDISDAPVLSAFINASRTISQTYNSSTRVYNPSYATGELRLTLNLTKAGTNQSLLPNVQGFVKWFKIENGNRTEITSTDKTQQIFLDMGKRESLVTKYNVPIESTTVRYEANGIWIDPISTLPVPFSAYIDTTVVQLGEAAVIANVYTANGNVFYNNQPSVLTVNADLYKGGSLSGGPKVINFFKADTSVNSSSSQGYHADAGLGWKLCTAQNTPGMTPNVQPNTNTNGQGVLTLTAESVVNTQTIRAIIYDRDGTNSKTVGVATIIDFSDPVVVSIESTGGDVFKNSQGSTTLNARLFQNGDEIDTAGSAYTYRWACRDKNGNLNNGFGGTGNPYRNGKTITVTANDVNSKATYICEVFSK